MGCSGTIIRTCGFYATEPLKQGVTFGDPPALASHILGLAVITHHTQLYNAPPLFLFWLVFIL